MFGKLTKYNFKSMGRLILPCYGASVGLAILSKIFLMISSSLSSSYINEVADIFAGMLNGLVGIFGMLIFAIILLIMFITIRDFYLTFSSKTGYLSFSLPASANQHLLSHLLVSVIYIIGSFLVTCVSAAILFIEYLGDIPDFFRMLSIENATTPFFLLILTAVILGILGVFMSQMQFYTSIAIGSQFKKSRIGGSILGYFVISMIQSFISPFLMIFTANNMSDFILYGSYNSRLARMLYLALEIILQLSIPMLIFGIIVFIAEYFFSKYIFTKRLNLV